MLPSPHVQSFEILVYDIPSTHVQEDDECVVHNIDQVKAATKATSLVPSTLCSSAFNECSISSLTFMPRRKQTGSGRAPFSKKYCGDALGCDKIERKLKFGNSAWVRPPACGIMD